MGSTETLVIFAAVTLAACSSNRPTFPNELAMSAYAAPARPGALVLVHGDDPTRDTTEIVATSGATVLVPLDGITLRCANIPCDATEPGHVRLRRPPENVDHVDVIVTREGFAPRTVRVPFGLYAPTVFAVLLTPSPGASP